MPRQERLKRCTSCGKKNISPFLKGLVCGRCKAEEEIERITGGRTTK